MEQSIENRYYVNRVDGRDAPGQKHHGCKYFVLDLNHDKHAIPALRAYKESCKETDPQLAIGLTHLLERLERGTSKIESHADA